MSHFMDFMLLGFLRGISCIIFDGFHDSCGIWAKLV